MRKELEKSFTQEAFLKALGFPEDAVFVEVYTATFQDEPRRIIVRVNVEVAEKLAETEAEYAQVAEVAEKMAKSIIQ